MMFRSIAACIGMAALSGTALAQFHGDAAGGFGRPPARLLLAQNKPDPKASAPSDAAAPRSSGDTPAASTGFGGALSNAPPPSAPAGTGRPSAAGEAPKPAAKTSPTASPAAITGTGRNGSATLPAATGPGAASPGGTAGSIPFGGPQTDVQPAYGSPLRDSGAGNGGVPVSSTAPSTLGGPINGTGNAYTSTLPNGTVPNGYIPSNQGAPAAASRESTNNPNGFTRQPLGGAPVTRDQFGTFGGGGGYNAQGVYNGTAAQSGIGNGYGSPYATVGRPTGGLLSTNVDATGPLRPYIPQNSGTIARPNSGYGVPNGSRPTHMDGRGIQRMN